MDSNLNAIGAPAFLLSLTLTVMTPLVSSLVMVSTIDKEGNVRACHPFTSGPVRTHRLSKQELRRLIAELEPTLTSPAAWPEKARAIEGACTTQMRVGKRSVRAFALDHAAEVCPDHKQIQQLHAASQRLNEIYNVTMAGGPKAAAASLARANAALKKEWPEAKPFTLVELNPHRNRATFRRMVGKRWVEIVVRGDAVSVSRGG